MGKDVHTRVDQHEERRRSYGVLMLIMNLEWAAQQVSTIHECLYKEQTFEDAFLPHIQVLLLFVAVEKVGSADSIVRLLVHLSRGKETHV